MISAFENKCWLLRKFGWVAETTSLLNWRTGNRTGGSNPPASARNWKHRSERTDAFLKKTCWWIRLTVRTHASHACNTSSILVSTTVKFVYALLAQLVEQLTLNQWVQGSNPWGCTNQKSKLKEGSENQWFLESFLLWISIGYRLKVFLGVNVTIWGILYLSI